VDVIHKLRLHLGATARIGDFVNRVAGERGEQRCPECRCFRTSLYNSSDRKIDEVRGCYAHRCLSPSRLQLRVAGVWHDCNANQQRITLAGWTGWLDCPPAVSLCHHAADLGWPFIASVRPAHGPFEGGTALTISGKKLSLGSRIFVCGVEATDVRADGNSGEIIYGTTGRVAEELEANRTCSIKVAQPDGRSHIMSGAFVYIGLPPKQKLIDLSGGWDIDKVISLAMRLWPYVMTAIVSLSALHWLFVIVNECTLQRRMEQAALRARHEYHPTGAL